MFLLSLLALCCIEVLVGFGVICIDAIVGGLVMDGRLMCSMHLAWFMVLLRWVQAFFLTAAGSNWNPASLAAKYLGSIQKLLFLVAIPFVEQQLFL